MNAFKANAVVTDNVVVYDAEFAMSAHLEHTRRELAEKVATEIELVAKVQELEKLLKAKDEKIQALGDQVTELKVHNELLKTDVRDCIAAHAGSDLDPDQIEARARFAKANVDLPARTKYDEFRDKFIKHGVYVPLYYDVDLSPGAPVGTGNGVPVADRNELHDLLAKDIPVYAMEKRAPEGKENVQENRVKMYFPYAEIEKAQLAFERLCPEFKANPRPKFKTASADVHHVDRSAPRLNRVPEPSARVQRAKQSRTEEAPKRRVNNKSAGRKK